MSHSIIAPTSAFFLSHKLAVVNLFEQARMVGIRHSVKEGRFRFISHKFTASNLRYQARRMNNRSYVTEQTTALHLIYQKFNYLRRKHPLFPWPCERSEQNTVAPNIHQFLAHQITKSLNCAIRCKHETLDLPMTRHGWLSAWARKRP